VVECNSGQHAHVPLLSSSINLVPAQAGKVIVSLASHWPCVTDKSDISTYGLIGTGKGDEHPADPMGVIKKIILSFLNIKLNIQIKFN